MAKSDLTAERLRELLHYDPFTGVFTRRVKFGKKKCYGAGSIAGFVKAGTGYAAISISGTHYLSHRLVWLYMTGDWPAHQIDHKDRCRTNNAWSNLREATNKQNCENTPARCASGVKGVWFWPRRNKWVAKIRHNGKTFHLGYHNTLELAATARTAAEQKYFTHSEACEPPI